MTYLYYRRTTRAGTALRRTRVLVTYLSTRTVFVDRTAFDAVSGVRIAWTRPVALQHRFRTSDQRVSVESGRTTALNSVVDDSALGARATSGSAVTRS